MKCLFTLLSFFIAELKAQEVLNFNKRFVECEDKWVAFQKGKDSLYSYGFIYIDAAAGLTFNYEGTFIITGNNIFIPKKLEKSSYKIRLQPNQVKVALIPDSKFRELQITKQPDWLKYYQTDTASVERLYRWGFLYNSWNECAKALTYLERAQQVNAGFKGLATELAFSYNCLEQYEKAIPVLEKAITINPAECYLYKELSYAQMHVEQLEKAAESGKEGIKICTDNNMKSEIAYNIAYRYYKKKDIDQFHFWADEVKKWATKGDQFTTGINQMETDIKK